MSKKKTKSKVKAPSFIEVLKALYLEKITNKLSDEQFIVQVRETIANAVLSKITIREEQSKLFKLIFHNYIKIFVDGKAPTLTDINAISLFFAKEFVKDSDLDNLSKVVILARDKAAELNLGNEETCKEILTVINKSFSLSNLTLHEQFVYLVKIVQQGWLEIANKEFDKMRNEFNPEELKEISHNIFLNTFRLRDIEYLKKVVDIFSVDLKSFFIEPGVLGN